MNLFDTPIFWEVLDTATGWRTSGTLPASSHTGGASTSLVLAHGGDQILVSMNTL
ncbi:uncharacterized protein K444DRAFT_618609 [Hyaloscypha bicolor E]|uniref:Uncharacterized protein n=1 Tax=Hyaloscypha bicolor E TaxID=1095630 RepID=A0A2J6STQ1_9HELO|nr:uncharacterized protein K444DRAFT_618609 [Hyaloscypha bicolor E]PMD54154.1 hypothetical protein K444DRAFT_618609 [Hyaloscypha bicolor E]